MKNEGIINAPVSHFQLKLLYKAETHQSPPILIFHSLSIKRIIGTTWVLAIWIRSSNSIIQKVHMFSKISPRDQWRILHKLTHLAIQFLILPILPWSNLFHVIDTLQQCLPPDAAVARTLFERSLFVQFPLSLWIEQSVDANQSLFC